MKDPCRRCLQEMPASGPWGGEGSFAAQTCRVEWRSSSSIILRAGVWWAASLHTQTSPCDEKHHFPPTGTPPRGVTALPHRVKPKSVFIPVPGRGLHAEILGCIQPRGSSAHCHSSVPRWGWEPKTSEVLGRADLVQQGPTIFSQMVEKKKDSYGTRIFFFPIASIIFRKSPN